MNEEGTMQRRELKPTFAKTGSAKGSEQERKEIKGANGRKTPPKKRAKLTFAEKPLLKATCGHTATAQICKDRCGEAKLDHRYRSGKHPCVKHLQNAGFSMFWAEARPFKPAHAKAILHKSGQNPRKNEILASPTRGRRSTNSENYL